MQVGADRTLADWPQITRYFAALASASAAVSLDTLGATTLGRPMIYATISTPANIRRRAELMRAQARLADPRGLTPTEEARLVARQPVVVVIQGNIHSTEVGASQMAMELAYRLATVDTLQRALANVVVVLIPSANPDGHQMVTEWYREGLGTAWEGGPMPWLYHPYVGHDNNRDWYMITQRETQMITDLLYRQWRPEVFYDVHQQGTTGMRLTVPPHVDPINPNIDPLIVRAINHIGAEMSLALEERGKAGVGDGVTYDLWWHGGARSTPTRHNMVGVLSEAASANIATPITLQASELRGHERGLPKYERRVNFPNPWPGGTWRLRDIMDYELIAAEALVRMLSQQREQYVRNFVSLGRKAVRRGETEAPYAFVIPREQTDPGAATELVEVLRRGGVEVQEVVGRVTVGGTAYEFPAIVRMNQPYRAHAKDLLEVQRFPKMEQWPGGPAERPYDVAGWTLPLQMGVTVVEVTEPLSETLATRTLVVPDAFCGPLSGAGVEHLSLRDTRHYTALVRLLGAGASAGFATAMVGYGTPSAGVSRVIAFGAPSRAVPYAGVSCAPLTGEASSAPASPAPIPRIPAIGVYKPWTANMDEGWTRWVLEDFEIPYRSLTDSAVKAGKLRDHFDVILVPDMNLRAARDGLSSTQAPPRYAGGLGDAGLAELKAFVLAGGTLVTLDDAAEIATEALGVPVRLIRVAARDSAVAEKEQQDPLYAPGSILRVLVDTRHPVAAGMRDTAAVYFTNSVTFDVPRGTAARVVARYPERADAVLLSGYLSGAGTIAGKAALVDVALGNGRVIMFGFRPQYRGQSYGTFKLLFNALLDGGLSARR